MMYYIWYIIVLYFGHLWRTSLQTPLRPPLRTPFMDTLARQGSSSTSSTVHLVAAELRRNWGMREGVRWVARKGVRNGVREGNRRCVRKQIIDIYLFVYIYMRYIYRRIYDWVIYTSMSRFWPGFPNPVIESNII